MYARKLITLSCAACLFAAVVMAQRPAAAADEFIVEFRLAKWKTAHVNDAKTAKTISDTLKKIGCEVSMHDHDGHTDIKYRCTAWRSLALPSDDAAHKWEAWLKKQGFETKHAH